MTAEKGENAVVDNPATLVWAVRLLYLQCAGLAALTVWLTIVTVTRTLDVVAMAIALIVLAAIGAVSVFFVARALGRRSLHARGPAIVVQLFVIAAGGFLVQVHPLCLGLVMLAWGVLTGVLVVVPPTTRALGVD
ncbi:hypothetical protein ODJ79_12250 [Actinoplanes sp. KI2]|uniref:hypothetical protein n=1 Tax=Actinoplanes sp. KI2 TaxID=2983315 RepID=UPI0021D5A51A|nr:hypothetical protein [Actinoplanes sp. KI2]MCU7724489.1 hypothetical protein [Actinoplanes sp. KI2]